MHALIVWLVLALLAYAFLTLIAAAWNVEVASRDPKTAADRLTAERRMAGRIRRR